jgi:hypothetical protein
MPAPPSAARAPSPASAPTQTHRWHLARTALASAVQAPRATQTRHARAQPHARRPSSAERAQATAAAAAAATAAASVAAAATTAASVAPRAAKAAATMTVRARFARKAAERASPSLPADAPPRAPPLRLEQPSLRGLPRQPPCQARLLPALLLAQPRLLPRRRRLLR